MLNHRKKSPAGYLHPQIDRTPCQRYPQLGGHTFILVTFSMSLRIDEILNRNVGDIDARRMKVYIHLDKGKKDRFVTLPHQALLILRSYWALHIPPSLVFPAGKMLEKLHRATKIMDRGSLQKSFKAILVDCGIRKPAIPHTFGVFEWPTGESNERREPR